MILKHSSILGLVKVFIVEKKRSEDQLQQINTDLQQTQVTEQHLDQLQVRICETIIITKINLYIDYYSLFLLLTCKIVLYNTSFWFIFVAEIANFALSVR